MRKIHLIVGVYMLLLIVPGKAQTKQKDFFIGKWDVLVVGTPGGDSKMIVTLSRKDGQLVGTIIREGKDPAEIIEIEETKNSVKVYFRHNFFKVNLFLSKKDETHCIGTLMERFKATGIRTR